MKERLNIATGNEKKKMEISTVNAKPRSIQQGE